MSTPPKTREGIEVKVGQVWMIGKTSAFIVAYVEADGMALLRSIVHDLSMKHHARNIAKYWTLIKDAP